MARCSKNINARRPRSLSERAYYARSFRHNDENRHASQTIAVGCLIAGILAILTPV
jgi:hypothetical protein